jgi:hypothetical protein
MVIIMSIERDFLKKLRYATHLENDLRKELEELLAQPEQEPEAWIKVNKETGYKTQVAYRPSTLKKGWEAIPLYAGSPKRARLSDEEVRAKYRDIALDNPLYVPSYYAGFRDAERAHGIGGGE